MQKILAVVAVASLLAACANAPPPNNLTLDTGIGATGSAGQAGGSAAPPRGTGNLSTTTVR